SGDRGKGAGGEEPALALRRPEPNRPEQRAPGKRPGAAHEVAAAVPGLVVDGTEKDRGVRIRHVPEARWLVARGELADARSDPLDFATTKRWNRCPRAPRSASCRRQTTGTSNRRRARQRPRCPGRARRRSEPRSLRSPQSRRPRTCPLRAAAAASRGWRRDWTP